MVVSTHVFLPSLSSSKMVRGHSPCCLSDLVFPTSTPSKFATALGDVPSPASVFSKVTSQQSHGCAVPNSLPDEMMEFGLEFLEHVWMDSDLLKGRIQKVHGSSPSSAA
jgi:hypothetical protein